MTRFGIGFVVGATALASLACAGGTRSGKAASQGGGKMIATAAQSGAPSGAADAAAGAAKPKQLEGRIERIDRAHNVTLAGAEQVGPAFEKFKVDDDTKITVNGEEATLSEVNPGDEVRASFSGQAEDLHVDHLDVVSSATQGTGSSSEGSAAPKDQGSATPADQGSGSSSESPGSPDQR